MNEWKRVPFRQVVFFQEGPGLTSDLFTEDGMPFLNIRCLQNKKIVKENCQHINLERALKTYGHFLLVENDLVISSSGTLGKSAFVKKEDLPLMLNTSIIRLRPINDKVLDRLFMNYLIEFRDFQDQILGLSTGSAQVNFGPSHLSKVQLWLPSISEQAKIAAILSCTDRVIELTEALIAKQQRLKAGLMQKLLTKGIDEQGKLRSEATHEFKDSPLGRIPVEWDTFTLSEIVPRADYGISVPLDDKTGIPVLRMNNLKDGEVDLTDLKYSSSIEAASLLLRPMDVLFNRTNSIEHVGRTSIWRGQLEKISFASYLVRLVPDTMRLLPEYLNYWLNLGATQSLIRNSATIGVHQVNINPTNLRKTPLSLPASLSEQQAIVDLLNVHSSVIHLENYKLIKLQKLKSGLMQNLLTGKVRVNALLETQPRAAQG